MVDFERALLLSRTFGQFADLQFVQMNSVALFFVARVAKVSVSPTKPGRAPTAKLAFITDIFLSVRGARFGIGARRARTAHQMLLIVLLLVLAARLLARLHSAEIGLSALETQIKGESVHGESAHIAIVRTVRIAQSLVVLIESFQLYALDRRAFNVRFEAQFARVHSVQRGMRHLLLTQRTREKAKRNARGGPSLPNFGFATQKMENVTAFESNRRALSERLHETDIAILVVIRVFFADAQFVGARQTRKAAQSDAVMTALRVLNVAAHFALLNALCGGANIVEPGFVAFIGRRILCADHRLAKPAFPSILVLFELCARKS